MKRFSDLSLYGFILVTALLGAGVGACGDARLDGFTLSSNPPSSAS